METKNSMTYFNDLIKNSNLKNRTKSDQSFFNLNSNQNLRKYIESLNTIEYSNIRSLFDNNNYQFFVNENRIPKNLFIFLEYSFLSFFYLISKPFLEITPDKIVFILFCFQLKQKERIVSYNENESLNKNKEIFYSENIADRSISEINRIKFKIISLILRKLFKKTVELEIIRLHYPYYETNIFINLLSKTINKIKIKRVLSKIFETANILAPNKLLDKNFNKIPSFISGIKIRIAGRLLTQRIVPRKTVKTISKGSLAKSNTIHLEKGRITNKNKRGAFSVTITLGHVRIS